MDRVPHSLRPGRGLPSHSQTWSPENSAQRFYPTGPSPPMAGAPPVNTAVWDQDDFLSSYADECTSSSSLQLIRHDTYSAGSVPITAQNASTPGGSNMHAYTPQESRQLQLQVKPNGRSPVAPPTIKRKPIDPTANLAQAQSGLTSRTALRNPTTGFLPPPPPPPPHFPASNCVSPNHHGGNSFNHPIPPPPPPPPPPPSLPPRDLRKVKSAAVLRPTRQNTLLQGPPPPPYSFDDSSVPTPPVASPSWPTESPSAPQTPAWKAALGEAQFFATGLLARPAESCRHYTIIRHSLALVWYRGPSTSVSVSILSDTPLPPNRRLFLQQKGFTGNAGMSLKAMIRTNDSWIDVTPQNRAEPSQIAPGDERAIQRDLARFTKKATGRAATHVPRETCIVRIPAAVEDGYFRLVLCDEKKKVLAGCPVFRIASASTDASVVRGASLRTMPLEIGVKVGSTIAAATVSKYTAPITSTVGSKIQQVAWKASTAKSVGATVYETCNMGEHVKEHRDNYGAVYQERYEALEKGPGMGQEIMVVGSDAGPENPFPVRFEGTVVQGTGLARRQLNMPTANLQDIPAHIKAKFGGVYIAWARIIADPALSLGIYDDWHRAVVTIAPPANLPPSVVPKNKVFVHILEDFDDVSFIGARVKVMLMAYLRPATRFSSVEETLDVQSKDILATLVSLGREGWEAEEAIDTARDQQSQKSVSERLTDLRLLVQDQVDRIPIHKIGVRSEVTGLKDQSYGTGGLWIPR